ncbi:GNAT family N-acetyltransferase [Alicyclobacillus shizuokensis]|uniref:GNAT family N-acetyltransferase n=1 Tax=Alicyclobacillus shizuokensis TaxID=392014 RepID=UPI00082A0178|nr:GNAT family N-acetyltransferase [Alicyclobacillus shizuokensis]MCL6625706.1 GNAT family N-acetyltransferase [Alicyclobacillus shizuokensis]
MSTTSRLALVRTDRLILRMPRPGDAASVFVIHGDPVTNRHNPAGPMTDMAEAQECISQWIDDWSVNGIGYWCVSTLRNPRVIGVGGVRVMKWSGRSVLNLYYRFAPDAWGKGHATEVAREAIRLADIHLPDLPVVVRTRPTNLPALQVAERVGLPRRPDLDTDEHVVYASWW